MSETVETGVRIGISGQFLNNKENFSEISRLFADLSSASNELLDVQARLRNCNHPNWLNSFENRCQRLKRDTKQELVSLVEKLEAKKISLQVKVDEIRAKLFQLEPSALDTRDTLAGRFFDFSASPTTRRMKNPDVIARNSVIDAHLDQPDIVICKILDTEFPSDGRRPAMGLPEKMFADFRLLSYTDAYELCPQRIHALISKRRGRSHLP